MENNNWMLGLLLLLGQARYDLEVMDSNMRQLREEVDKVVEKAREDAREDDEKGAGFPGTPSYEDGRE